jgi:hypothetical protein
MSTLMELIQSLVPHIPDQAERDQAYLDHAVDLSDLERRLREVEARGCADTPGLVQGLFLD